MMRRRYQIFESSSTESIEILMIKDVTDVIFIDDFKVIFCTLRWIDSFVIIPYKKISFDSEY